MFKLDTSEMVANLRKYRTLLDRVASDAVSAALTEAEAEAKSNAPWTDRTGNARASITGTEAEKVGDNYQGHLYIGMYYGVFLELCNDGKYRIVWPTLEQAATKLPSWVRWSYARNVPSHL